VRKGGSDSNRRRIGSLRSLLPSITSDPERVIQTADRILELLEAESCALSGYAADVLHQAATRLSAEHASTHAARAEEMAARAAEIYTRTAGAQSSAAQDCMALMERMRQAQSEEWWSAREEEPSEDVSLTDRRKQA